MSDCCQHIYVIQDLENQIKVLKRQIEQLQAIPNDESRRSENEEIKAKRPYKRRNSGEDSQ